MFRRKFSDLASFSIFESKPTISGLTKTGFLLSDGVTQTNHGVAVVQDRLFLWDSKIERDAFTLFDILTPKPDILVIGTGKTSKPDRNVASYLADLGIQTEMLDTRNALATFNVLQSEGRKVAACLAPPSFTE